MLTVTKETSFEYAHFLKDYDGLCSRCHGHSGKLFVTVEEISDDRKNEYPSMVIDFSKLKKIVNDEITSKLDHQLINDLSDDSLNPPTAENMVKWIVEKLKIKLGKALYQVRLYETATSYATWTRE